MSNNTHILIVDDNIINRKYFTMSLTKSNYQTMAVESGFEALRELQRRHYDIILMDIRMPDMDGYETTLKIRKIKGYEKTPVLATSAEVIKKGNETLFNDFLLKPISPQQLLNAINHVKNDSRGNQKLFNRISALECAFNDVDIMNNLILMFVKELPNQIILLEKHIQQNQYKLCRELIHKIIGSSKICGAVGLENQLNNLSSSLIEEDKNTLFHSLKLTKRAASEYLGHIQKNII